MDETEDTSGAVDAYLARLEQYLTVHATTRAAILDEVRAHLAAVVDERLAAGAPLAAAEASAVAAFGAPLIVAARFNAVHPIEWDLPRLVRGLAWGIVLAWSVWTLVTFPLLVQATVQHSAGGVEGTALSGTLFFQATPLAFGLFRVVAGGNVLALVALALLLALFGALPFLWGQRAGRWWQPGLAVGLGVVVGFPWLVPGLVYRWNPYQWPVLVLTVVAIWLLLPYALLASWLGQRFGRLSQRRMRATSGRSLGSARSGRRGVILGVGIAAVFLIVNVWSWQRVSASVPRPIPLDQQLRSAQAAVTFAAHQPGYVPAGVRLAHVVGPQPGCTICGISYDYQGEHGAWLTLGETPARDDNLRPDPLPTSPNYQISNIAVTGIYPVWWLANETTTEHQVSLVWTANGVDYLLGSSGAYTVAELTHMADSLSG